MPVLYSYTFITFIFICFCYHCLSVLSWPGHSYETVLDLNGSFGLHKKIKSCKENNLFIQKSQQITMNMKITVLQLFSSPNQHNMQDEHWRLSVVNVIIIFPWLTLMHYLKPLSLTVCVDYSNYDTKKLWSRLQTSLFKLH